MMTGKFYSPLLIFSLAFCPSAFAQELDLKEREIRTSWTISKIDSHPSNKDEELKATDGELLRTVNSGDLVMKQRLIPLKAAVLTQALGDGKGKEIAPAGAQLYGLLSGSGEVYCLAKAPDFNVVGALFVGASAHANCFKDSDGDGNFDGRFRKKSMFYGLPIISGKHSKKLKPISGGAYTSMSPEEMERSYFVGVKFEGKPLLHSRKNFRIVYGDKNNQNSLSDWFYTKGNEYPQTKTVLGGAFTVLSEDNGAVNVRIDKPFEEQPFSVSISISYR